MRFGRWAVGVPVLASALYLAFQPNHPGPLPTRHMSTARSGAAKAVVLGGTGAIGRELVGTLLSNAEWTVVTTVGRRSVDIPESYGLGQKELEASGRLKQVVTELDNLPASAFAGADVVFCTLGTTRKQAGSAKAFRLVDHDYVVAAGKAAKDSGVNHFSLVSSNGANKNIWANDWQVFHGLNYIKTKGLVEQALIDLSFPRLSIYRPGLLDRGGQARGPEKLFLSLLNNIKVADVAADMAEEAARAEEEAVVYHEMAPLMSRAKMRRGGVM